LNQLVHLAEITVRDSKTEETAAVDNDLARLDERFLHQPAVAVEQSHEVLLSMTEKAMTAMTSAMDLLNHYDESKVKTIQTLESETDKYEDVLGGYLVKIGEQKLSEHESECVSLYLQNIGDLERIADHALNLAGSFEEMREKGIDFSDAAKKDLQVLMRAVKDVNTLTLESLKETDITKASHVEPLEQVVDTLTKEVRDRHIIRLREGTCTIELGYVLADITTDLERVSDHCSNLAASVIMSSKESYDTHAYLYKQKGNDEFRQLYNQLAGQYQILS